MSRKKVEISEEIISKLGVYPDRILASESNTSVSFIYTLRKTRGIGAHRKHHSSTRKIPMAKMGSLVESLGKTKDCDLSQEYGVSREYIRQLRKKHNVPKFKRAKGQNIESIVVTQ